MNEVDNTDILSESTAMETETDTLVGATVSVDDLQAMTSDIVHVSLLGSFLVSGTIVGVFLFWRLFK